MNYVMDMVSIILHININDEIEIKEWLHFTIQGENEFIDILDKHNQVCYMNSKINITDSNIIGMCRNCYMDNNLFWTY